MKTRQRKKAKDDVVYLTVRHVPLSNKRKGATQKQHSIPEHNYEEVNRALMPTIQRLQTEGRKRLTEKLAEEGIE